MSLKDPLGLFQEAPGTVSSSLLLLLTLAVQKAGGKILGAIKDRKKGRRMTWSIPWAMSAHFGIGR